ncbi:MAG: hypothetical protein AB1633_09925, partial [Elusimicrobiota bacterium]
MKSCYILAIFLLFAFFNCSHRESKNVVAEIKGLKIYKSQVDSIFASTSQSKENIRTFIKTKFDNQAMFCEAKRLRMHKREETSRAINAIENYHIYKSYTDHIIRRNWGFSDDEIKAYYEKNKGFFKLNDTLYKSRDAAKTEILESLCVKD